MDQEDLTAMPKRAKGKAKAKAKSGAGAGGSRPGKGPCLCCQDPRHSNTRFCKLHKRAYDSMAYQARKAEESGEVGAVQAFQAVMGDDVTAKSEICKFCELNPPDSRYARKSFIDWTCFTKMYGHRTEIIDRSKCKPMWEGEFLLWAQNEKALTKAEAESWWQEYLNDPRVERDNDGYKGRLQLWVPCGVSKLTDKSKYTDSVAQQGCKTLKNPKAEDIEMLQTHVKRQRQSVVDPFFTNSQSHTASHSQGSARTQPTTTSEANAGEENSDLNKRRKTIDVDREAPKLMKSMQKELSTLKKDATSAASKAKAALTSLEKADAPLLYNDLALAGLVRSLDLRLHFLARWTDEKAHTEESQSNAIQVKRRLLGMPSDQNQVAERLLSDAETDFQKHCKQTANELLEENRTRLPCKASDRFMSEPQMSQRIEATAGLRSAEDFVATKAEWQTLVSCAGSLFTSTLKVAQDVSEHVATKQREEKRQEIRRKAAEKAEALKVIRQQAKDAADEIRAKPKAAASKEPVFSVDLGPLDLDSVPKRRAFTDNTRWDNPWVFKEWPKGQSLLQDVGLGKSLDTFAAQYKKLGDTGGRHQYSLQTGGVKSLVDCALQEAMPASPLDLEKYQIEGASKFMGASWLYGFSPGMAFAGLLPNGASQIRLHVKGKVSLLLFDAKDLASKMLDGAESFTKVHNYVTTMTEGSFAECKGKNVRMWVHELGEQELLYIPAGFFTVELVDAHASQVYGIRKSFFPVHASTLANYEAVKKQFQGDGRNSGLMESVCKALTAELG